MAVTSITDHYYMITNKFENLHALQRKINTRALLPDARPSRPILAVKKVTYIQALRLNTVQPIGPLAFLYIYIYYTNSQQKDPKDAVPPREFVDKYRVRMVGQTDLTKFNYFLAVWPSSD